MTSNDSRGWILASVSGLACAFGACCINLDIVLHVVPRWRSFHVHESTTFLAASLSLSFGVMFFSALFNLLPVSQSYFLQHGYPPDKAGYASVGSFLVGVLGLQLISELLHRCLPSSIVSCDDHGGVNREHSHDSLEEGRTMEVAAAVCPAKPPHPAAVSGENSPLLGRSSLKSAASFLVKSRCVDGKCYGYSDHPCHPICVPERTAAPSTASHAAPHNHSGHSHGEEGPNGSHHQHDHSHAAGSSSAGHHHIAKNKFLSIGVQTSLAIALHKFPEGLITYATNHVDPTLGFNVFIALFVHNIAEGFAMSLPLFLALRSRTKAIVWASLLGGLAQPAGAFVAWLSIRGHEFQLNRAIYGVLFSITAGIMCSVGLQLFSQAIHIHHGSRLSFIWAFIGMSIMGFSGAITAK